MTRSFFHIITIMTKNRTLKELLQLAFNNQHLFDTGLCALYADMRHRNIITVEERDLLNKYTHSNQPLTWEVIDGKIAAFVDGFKIHYFFWKPYKREPRMKWLKKHIKKHENKT